jgi:carbonic anhydrase
MIFSKLKEGNMRYLRNSDPALRIDTAENGQHPYAVVICCSDSRVIPEEIFDASIGDLFVIRTAGNVLDKQQFGSIEYAVEHLRCRQILMLGHTGCGAIGAALGGEESDGYISSVTDYIRANIGSEKDPYHACRLNVEHGVNAIRRTVHDADVAGAIYDIRSGEVEWL